MNTATIIADLRDLPTITVGLFRSRFQGEILLVYLNNEQNDPTVLRYDTLTRQDRSVVQAIAQDPLSVLKRTRAVTLAQKRVVNLESL